MHGSQIERLKRDSKELKHYIKKQEKKGDSNLVYKLRAKYEYLNSRISEVELDIARIRYNLEEFVKALLFVEKSDVITNYGNAMYYHMN